MKNPKTDSTPCDLVHKFSLAANNLVVSILSQFYDRKEYSELTFKMKMVQASAEPAGSVRSRKVSEDDVVVVVDNDETEEDEMMMQETEKEKQLRQELERMKIESKKKEALLLKAENAVAEMDRELVQVKIEIAEFKKDIAAVKTVAGELREQKSQLQTQVDELIASKETAVAESGHHAKGDGSESEQMRVDASDFEEFVAEVKRRLSYTEAKGKFLQKFDILVFVIGVLGSFVLYRAGGIEKHVCRLALALHVFRLDIHYFKSPDKPKIDVQDYRTWRIWRYGATHVAKQIMFMEFLDFVGSHISINGLFTLFLVLFAISALLCFLFGATVLAFLRPFVRFHITRGEFRPHFD